MNVTTDILAIAAGVLALVVAGMGLWLKQSIDAERDALLAAANSTRAQELAEAACDAEHVSRAAAEAAAASDRIQLEATQRALAAANQELVKHVPDLIAHAPADVAAAALRGVFAESLLPAAGAAGPPAAGGGDAGPAGVPAAGAASAAPVRTDPSAGR